MPRNDELVLAWSNRWSLTQRILAINVFALAILAGSLFYLDSYRQRIVAARLAQAETEVRMIADAVSAVPLAEREPLLTRLGAESRARLRIYSASGAKLMDSWNGARPTYTLRNPVTEPWTKKAARKLDKALDWVVGADRPPRFVPSPIERLSNWPEAQQTLVDGRSTTGLRRAPEGTPFLSAAAALPRERAVLLLTFNARDIRGGVRSERLTLGFILLGTILLSALLSFFLARTIARPLRRLARAAHRVRLGRAREVDVPTLPKRRDEIGLLARALHDMTQSLRYRIDATEAFAADVTHELKNPLASLRSAVDSLERVDDPALQKQLLDVVRNDVNRLDRLIVNIAEVSRLDAELSRARYERIDLGKMIESLLPLWEKTAAERGIQLAFARPRIDTAVIMGEELRVGRALANLVDNAISFSPPEGLVEIVAAQADRTVTVSVEDQGPGVPPEDREEIFKRFHSVRPSAEPFGQHSGLGLSIAAAIVKAHDGAISVGDRHDGRVGARFTARFPAAPAAEAA